MTTPKFLRRRNGKKRRLFLSSRVRKSCSGKQASRSRVLTNSPSSKKSAYDKGMIIFLNEAHPDSNGASLNFTNVYEVVCSIIRLLGLRLRGLTPPFTQLT